MNEATALALLDTNVLIYADQLRNKHHQAAKSLRDRGRRGEVFLCISPQVLSEFYAFMTRTDGRGLGKPLPPSEAGEEVRKYLESEHIRMICPTPGTWPLILDSLLKQRPVSGLDIHDLHLAATMLSNGVKRIYTFNVRDFEPLSDIEVLIPPEVEPAADETSAQSR